MRSRYTAFVVGDIGYLERTWHPRTRPDRIEMDEELAWTGLEILETTAGESGDTRGTVEFRASWREGSVRGSLHERSRFVFQREQWWYLDGHVS